MALRPDESQDKRKYYHKKLCGFLLSKSDRIIQTEDSMIALEQNRNVNIIHIKDKSARAGCGENPEESAKKPLPCGRSPFAK